MRSFDFARRRYRDTFAYLAADMGVVLLAIAATSVPQIAADFLLDDRGAMLVAGGLGLVQIYVNLLITFRALDHAGIAPPGYVRADLTEGRFGSAFAMSLVSLIAILAGLVALIVPGMLLILLWSVALPVIAAERAGAIDSLRRSWRLARPALGPLAAVLAPLAAVLLLFLAAVVASAYYWAETTPVEIIGGNLLLSALSVVGASVWAFAYGALRDGGDAE